jgi:folate-binding protein YgfZ
VSLGPFDLLRLQGAESLDLLQRISTNDLRGLRPGEARSTVFTTEKGRIVDFVRVLAAEDGALLIASGGAGPSLCNWIGRFVIMEDILVTDLSVASRLQAAVGGDVHNLPPAGTGSWKQGSDGGEIVCDMTEFGIRWHFAGGAVPGATPAVAQPDAGELVRVLRGIPSRGAELRDAFTPYDAGLTWAVSTTKGCYIGQEVLARLETYQKIRRRLAGVLFGGLSGVVRAGEPLFSDGEEVGVLTSIAPAQGLVAALAVLRTGIGDGGVVMTGEEGASAPGTVFALPATAELRARIPGAPPA